MKLFLQQSVASKEIKAVPSSLKLRKWEEIFFFIKTEKNPSKLKFEKVIDDGKNL